MQHFHVFLHTYQKILEAVVIFRIDHLINAHLMSAAVKYEGITVEKL